MTPRARNFTLKPTVESTVKSASTAVRIYLIAVAVGRVKLVEEELEILVGILLMIASQSLIVGYDQLDVAPKRIAGLSGTYLVAVPRSNKDLQRRVAVHFIGSA